MQSVRVHVYVVQCPASCLCRGINTHVLEYGYCGMAVCSTYMYLNHEDNTKIAPCCSTQNKQNHYQCKVEGPLSLFSSEFSSEFVFVKALIF